MRGKGCVYVLRAAKLGITPAYAGKRNAGAVKRRKPKDHPRLCGEKFRIHLFITCQPGSPPPMRGKVEQREQMQISIRITPAYAGKS